MCTLRDSMLLRYVNLSTACQFLSVHGNCWFLVLFPWSRLVRYHSLLGADCKTKDGAQAMENRFMECCMSSGLPALRVQSSVNRKWRSLSKWTLVLAWRRRKLNSLQSLLYLMSMPWSESWKASVSMAVNVMLNSVGASRQPCFTLFVTGKGVDDSPLSRTWAWMLSWNWRTNVMNLSGHPNLLMMLQRPLRLMVSKAFVRSTKAVYRSTSCSWHFSCSWRAANTMLMVPHSYWKPHWLSGSRSFSRCSMRRFRRILARTFQRCREVIFLCGCHKPVYCLSACRGEPRTHF